MNAADSQKKGRSIMEILELQIAATSALFIGQLALIVREQLRK